MGKPGHAPHNGPSKTGNPSGKGRGNNSAWDDDEASSEGGWTPQRIDWSWKPTPQEVRDTRERDNERKILAHANELVRARIELIRTTRDQAMKNHDSAEVDYARALHARIENIAMFLQASAGMHMTPEVAEVRTRLQRTLTNHEVNLLRLKLAIPPGPIAQSIMQQVTIDDWLRHFRNVVDASN